MKKELQLCSLNQAKKLKALGFKWETHEHYCGSFMELQTGQCMDRNSDPLRSECSAPSVALALKWMRDEKGFYFGIIPVLSELIPEIQGRKTLYIPTVRKEVEGYFFCDDLCSEESYEAAESALLDELLKRLEEAV